MKPTLSAERLRELFSYNPLTGELIRLKSCNHGPVGSVAGCLDTSKGYIKVGVDGGVYRAHRLIWLHIHGHWPEDELDHINGDRSDNRICNLRPATRTENSQNRTVNANNVSGYPGVSFHKSSGWWRSSVNAAGLGRLVGYFKTPEEAYEAYKKGKAALHAFCPTVRNSQQEKAAA